MLKPGRKLERMLASDLTAVRSVGRLRARASLLIQLLYPISRIHHLTEHRRLRDQNRVVQVLVGNLAGIVSDRQRAGCVGEKLYAVAPMESVARGAVAAHLRHVAAHG